MSDRSDADRPARMLLAPFAEKLATPILYARDPKDADRYLQCLPFAGGMTMVRERQLMPPGDPLEACLASETALLCACSAIDARQNQSPLLELRFEHPSRSAQALAADG